MAESLEYAIQTMGVTKQLRNVGNWRSLLSKHRHKPSQICTFRSKHPWDLVRTMG